MRAELARPACQGSALARGLDEQIAEFARTDLGTLPSPAPP